MKGPGLRSKLDTRRLWKCPECNYERYAPGIETAVQCHCNKSEPFMKLVEAQRYMRPASGEPDYYIEFTDEELAELSAKKTDDSSEQVASEIDPEPSSEEE